MRSLTSNFVNFIKREEGTTTPEKAVMSALVVALCIASVLFLSKKETDPLQVLGIQTTVHASSR